MNIRAFVNQRTAVVACAVALIAAATIAAVAIGRPAAPSTLAPAAAASTTYSVEFEVGGDSNAINILTTDGRVRVRQPWGQPITTTGRNHTATVVATARDTGGAVFCRIFANSVVVAEESGDGPRATAVCVWTAGDPALQLPPSVGGLGQAGT